MYNMKDFSVLWAGDYVSIISPDDTPYEALYEPDSVHVIPVDVPTAEIFVRRETCPPYTVRDRNNYDQYLTVVSGGLEDEETSEEGAKREVQEELGIDLDMAEYELIRLTPDSIPYAKNTSARITLFALMLFDYKMSEPEGDGLHMKN